ncbi:hypothetical protein [Oricola sp.]|uniref:hypothetical protein n=1 Tax=Oricola sp. TaxID=1979950 RepID=UPI0025D91B45|nr:hypothetical protein [Oricola sp.]MCI5073779.1 hypothetical protein [Oricola sp.]
MPLPVLVAVVASGIAVIVLVVHLTGGSRVAEIADERAALERFAIDYPDVDVTRCILSQDRCDAVLELDDGHVGLVHAIGSKYLTRFVNRGEMSATTSSSEAGAVELNTGDITWPRARLHFADDETAVTVAGLFADEIGPMTNERAA